LTVIAPSLPEDIQNLGHEPAGWGWILPLRALKNWKRMAMPAIVNAARIGIAAIFSMGQPLRKR
jgi:hypothetical protein